MRLILNEKKMLDKSLSEGYVDDKKPSNTIRILAKHYLSIGMNKAQIFETIDSFLIKNYEGYNTVKWGRTINRIINALCRKDDHSLLNINSIQITKNEILKIKEINNFRLEKLAFVLLVYAKIYNKMNKNDSNWVNEQHKYIFSDAKIRVTKKEQGIMIYKLKELGYVDVPMMVDSTNIKVNFVDNDSESIIEVTDFRNFVYEYFMYFEIEKYMRCVKCNKLIKLSNNKLKYCLECAREVKLENDRRIQKERYYSRK